VTDMGSLVATARPAVIGLVAAVALATVTALSRARGRRLERRMAAELGRRSEPSTAPSGAAFWTVGAARTDDPDRRDPELRITLEELLEQRDHLLASFQQVQTRIHEMRMEERRDRVVGSGSLDNVVALRDRRRERDLAAGRQRRKQPYRSS
jgi:hypothetical protein